MCTYIFTVGGKSKTFVTVKSHIAARSLWKPESSKKCEIRPRSPLHVGFPWHHVDTYFENEGRDKQMDGHNRKHATLLPNCILWHPWDVVKVSTLKVLFESSVLSRIFASSSHKVHCSSSLFFHSLSSFAKRRSPLHLFMTWLTFMTSTAFLGRPFAFFQIFKAQKEE